MSTATQRFAWLRSGLLWRTFFLLAFLIATSMATWIAIVRIVERAPRANQIAAQIVSIVTVTRAALTHSAPDLRRELLFDLASNEGIRVYPLESTDKIESPPDTGLMPTIQASVKAQLGNETRFAGTVNEVDGFWVSFNIDDDAYWMRLDRERIERTFGIQWIGWAAVTLWLALLGAVFISRLINQPLARLTAVAHAIAKGAEPDPLPEGGPREIIDANRSFNQMVNDLKRVEADRAVILAGISHDLRTPIARMLLEVEMAKLSDDAREGMQSDLAQMDAIIGQFLDYARPGDATNMPAIDLTALLSDAARHAARIPDVTLHTQIDEGIKIKGNAIELSRVIGNIIENARRYGKTEGKEKAEIDIKAFVDNEEAVVEIGDHGRGVPDLEIDRLLKPFTRLDQARGQANGAGLGLAIVDRVIKRHQGRLKLSNRPEGGLMITIAIAALN